MLAILSRVVTNDRNIVDTMELVKQGLENEKPSQPVSQMLSLIVWDKFAELGYALRSRAYNMLHQ